MQIILTRHGEVEGIHPERFRGRMELELTALGRQQAKAVAHRIAAEFAPQAVYTSPMGRCRDTGAEIASACGLSAQVLDGVNDLDYGQWQWKTHDEVKSAHPQAYALWKAAPQWVRFPGGESLQDLALRTADGLRALMQRHAEHTVVLVGHDSVNRAMLLQVLDLPLSAYWRITQQPCCLNVFEVDRHGKVTLLRVNDTAHLREFS
ncbi:histidine phosphatase family protein [Thiomonas intermedia]|uniref:histidine phosphatase family protein n=1 Tax=Thiomonas intermedia TaxID=926 RepID=UPI0009A4A844|nr:histidine phosphatase family protein [Thiomonas intermedia]